MEFIGMSGKGYIACAHFEESIHHYGEADTPEKALAAFVEGGEFADYCDCREIEDGTYVQVKVFKAIYAEIPEANVEDWEDGWEWILGGEVSEHQVQFLA
tara:strand:- start:340 stop:639 length:300 start_codon:yes stop_codon:yes gene_type:complete